MVSIESLWLGLKGIIENLWINLKETTENLGIFSAIPIAIIVLILIILIIIEKKLRKKIRIMKGNRNAAYIRRINKINQTDPKHTLERIDRIARDFFRERFEINSPIEYSELERFFIQQKNKETAEFCSLMNDLLYSGKITNEKINQKLIQDLANIIENNRIPNKEELKKSVLDKIGDVELKIKEKIFG
jgi:hypothetical protein